MLLNRHADLYRECVEYIAVREAKDAFHYFVGVAATLMELQCHPQRKGEVLDFRFLDQNDEQPFAFIVNKASLLFYFRDAAIKSGRYSLADLRKGGLEVNESNAGEWTVKLSNIDDVKKLIAELDVR